MGGMGLGLTAVDKVTPMRRVLHLVEEVLRRLLLASRATRIPAVRRLLFRLYYHRNTWRDSGSRSGEGSNLDQTAVIREKLPGLFEKLSIRSVLDVPCGDGYWWRHVEHSLDRYIGADVVPEVIKDLSAEADTRSEYRCLDVSSDPLPQADAILSRDLLVHFSEDLIGATLRNMKRSGAAYLITTTFPGRVNRDIETGRWRPIDLQASPFNFPEPVALINEGAGEYEPRFADKSLGVWRLADVPAT